MCSGALVMMVGIPLALGSWRGLLVVAAAAPVLIWRILDEEALLKREHIYNELGIKRAWQYLARKETRWDHMPG